MPFNTSSLLSLLVSLVLFCLPVFFCVVFFRFNVFFTLLFFGITYTYSASSFLLPVLSYLSPPLSSFLISPFLPPSFPHIPPSSLPLPSYSPYPPLPFFSLSSYPPFYHMPPFPYIPLSSLPLPLLICPLPLISHPPTVLSPPLPPSPILPQYKTSNTSKQSWTELQPSPASQSQATSVSL